MEARPVVAGLKIMDSQRANCESFEDFISLFNELISLAAILSWVDEQGEKFLLCLFWMVSICVKEARKGAPQAALSAKMRL